MVGRVLDPLELTLAVAREDDHDLHEAGALLDGLGPLLGADLAGLVRVLGLPADVLHFSRSPVGLELQDLVDREAFLLFELGDERCHLLLFGLRWRAGACAQGQAERRQDGNPELAHNIPSQGWMVDSDIIPLYVYVYNRKANGPRF